MQIDWLRCPGVTANPNILGGTYHFAGTRVSIEALFANLADGATLGEFLSWFPGVRKEDAESVLRFAAQMFKSPELA